jgi:hypothetical protein
MQLSLLIVKLLIREPAVFTFGEANDQRFPIFSIPANLVKQNGGEPRWYQSAAVHNGAASHHDGTR